VWSVDHRLRSESRKQHKDAASAQNAPRWMEDFHDITALTDLLGSPIQAASYPSPPPTPVPSARC
jgi:hypothetical protein